MTFVKFTIVSVWNVIDCV